MRIRQTLFSGLVFLGLSAPLAAQPLIWEVVELPVDDALIEVFTADGQFVAHGEAGTVLRSADGRIWEDVSVPTVGDLTHGVQWNGRWLVSGPDAGIWVSDDQGLNWVEAQRPVLGGDVFRPESIVVQSNGELLSIGGLPAVFSSPFPDPCWRTAATSDDGVTWSLRAEHEFRGKHIDAIAVDDGFLNATFVGSMPECTSIPLIGAHVLDYYQGDSESGFTRIMRINTAYNAVQRRGILWNGNELWWVGVTLVSAPLDAPWVYQDWIARDSLSGLDPSPERINLNSKAYSLTVHAGGFLVAHLGRVSFVSTSGEVEVQLLPVADQAFRFESRGDVVVGVGEGGVAVRGSLPLSLAVPLDQPGFLLFLCALLWLAGLGSLPGRRSA